MSNDQYGAVDAELVPGALRGYRSWRVLDDELTACNFPLKWPVGVMESRHVSFGSYLAGFRIVGCKASPQKDHSCGIYANHEPGYEDSRGWIVGSIKAYGRTIVGTRGFRAGKAEVEALTLNPDALNKAHWSIRNFEGKVVLSDPLQVEQMWDTVHRLGWNYQVPVFRSTEALVEAFPPISVAHLLGDWEAKEARRQQEIYARVFAWSNEGVQKIHAQLEEIEARIRAAKELGDW